MYLSNELISKRVKSAKRLLIVGGIFTAMSVYGIVAGLAGNAKLRSGLATYLVMLVMFGAVFLLGILNQNQVRLPKRFATIFSANATGTILVRDLAKQLNMSYDKTLAELNRAMNRGYLVNCYLNQSGEAAIILPNITAADNYVTVICPNCGGSNQVRAGFSGVCSYCNSPLSGK